MEASTSDWQRIGLTIAAVIILFGVVAGISFLVRPKNSFEREQARAEASNPEWVHVDIRTADNRRRYHEGEPIKVIARFYSDARYKYKIEIAEGYSTTATDLLHLSNGQRLILNNQLIVCCSSRLIGLDDEGYSPPTNILLKLEPGEYEMYLTSRRVFNWDIGPEEYNPSSFEVASELLKIRVVPSPARSHSPE